MERRLSSRPLPLLTLSDWLSPELLHLQNNANPFIRMIQNNLVAEHLAKYLGFLELQAVTLVSKDSLSCFRNTKSFSNKARFTIRDARPSRESSSSSDDDEDDDNEEVDIMEPMHVFQRSKYDWKNLTIQLGVPGLLSDHGIAEMEDRLRSVESVLMYTSSSNFRRADVLAEWLQFEPMLERMENLRELKIYSTSEMANGELFTSGELLTQVFCKLNSLKIVLSYGPQLDTYPPWNFRANLLQPCKSSNSQPTKFYVASLILFMRSGFGFSPSLNVVKIVHAMKDTLEELKLRFEVGEMKTIRLPNLKRLLLQIDAGTPLEEVETFLQNQVPLEELRIMANEIPLDLLEHLQEAGKLGNLQKLCIQGCSLPSGLDRWTFLKGMKKLKVVHVANWWCSPNYCFCENHTDDSDEIFTRELKIIITNLREWYPMIEFIECFETSSQNCGLYEPLELYRS